MENKVKNRAWVKDAAIVFLIILLLLTFFSSTIMNHTLPEVATQRVADGTITAKVRGTGTVAANGNHNVKATGTMSIAKVMVKAGQQVETGDILFVLGAGDSEELEAAKIALEDAQLNYASTALSAPRAKTYTASAKAYEDATNKRNEAQKAFDEAKTQVSDEEIKTLLKEKDKLVKEISDYKSEMANLDAQLLGKEAAYLKQIEVANQLKEQYAKLITTQEQAEIDAAQEAYNQALQNVADPANITPEEESAITNAQKNLDALKQKYSTTNYTEEQKAEINAALAEADKLKAEYNDFKVGKDSDYAELNNKIQRKQVELDLINSKFAASTAAANYVEKQKALAEAESNLKLAGEALQDEAYSNAQAMGSANVALTGASNQVKRAQDKVKKLSGEGDDEDNCIKAKVPGTVTEVNCTAGDTVVKDDIMAVIEVPDMGYTVSFSVTNDQAKRLRVGDSATISNYYWGNEVKATLSSIATDKKNPMTNKLLTFDVEGDVNSGAELTISVGQKSARYDIIVPNSAIKSDSNGSFVLAVMAKNSPLGNRYIAKRVSIEVLASDDQNSAVTADLAYGDYVITTSSAPIKSGDQVRLTDSAN